MIKDVAADGSGVRSVDRALGLLLAMSGGALPLTQLAQRCGLSKATAHRLLKSLQHRHMVSQDSATLRYGLGPGCLPLVEGVMLGHGGLGIFASAELEALREATQETVTIHIGVANQRLCTWELPSEQSVRYLAGVGKAEPIHCGSAGKLLLAYRDEFQIERFLKHAELEALTPNSITDRAALRRELDAIQARGWAFSCGERSVGGVAVSVPIFAPSGDVLAALSVLGPESRFTRDRILLFRTLLTRTSQQISKRLNVPAER